VIWVFARPLVWCQYGYSDGYSYGYGYGYGYGDGDGGKQ